MNDIKHAFANWNSDNISNIRIFENTTICVIRFVSLLFGLWRLLFI